MGKLHDALKASGYEGHDLERLLVRLLFCLFADDTGIFEPRGIFDSLIRDRTQEDGSDTGGWLSNLFDVLNQPETRRQKALDDDLKQFAYINGDLFKARLPVPAFDTAMRNRLLEACAFSWDAVSPAIFGALFQSVMNKKERRAQGAHYTTETNILKVIEPLFVDGLRAEYARLAARRDTGRANALRAFQAKLAGLNFLDPACGCGNFLIIAYRELRALELEVIKDLNPDRDQQQLDVSGLSLVDVGQFYGIEINEFPSRIAEVALWMMDHIMNVRLSLEFGQVFARIPLKAAPHIHCADALELDWTTVLAPTACAYVLGNPPFVGGKKQSAQAAAQRAQVKRIANLGDRGGTLDFVTAWFIKAGEYVRKGSASIGFVATNSITQGEQVPQLWPILFDRHQLEIAFAHRTFAWGSDARGVAHVHVVIVGLVSREAEPADKRLFSYSAVNGAAIESRTTAISPYLFDAAGFPNPKLTIRVSTSPINGAPRLKTGVQMIDDGIMTFTQEERDEFLQREPAAAPLFRDFLGGDEYINGFNRAILYLRDAQPQTLRSLPLVRKRMEALRKYRAGSDRPSTIAMADYPTRLGVDERLDQPFLVIPNTSSERREYVPIGWLEPHVVASQKLRILANAELWVFAVLTSRMHMAWMRAITGRMKSDYMYSVGIVYNNFPWPVINDVSRNRLSVLAQAVLNARAEHPSASLADLYDVKTMPEKLRRAHNGIDTAVDRLYRQAAFPSDRDRVLHLFGLYEGFVTPLTATAPTKKPRRQPAIHSNSQ